MKIKIVEDAAKEKTAFPVFGKGRRDTVNFDPIASA